MEEFVPGQRWTSAGEPGLGIGIVAEVNSSRVLVHFPIANENRQYALDNTPLKRVVFKAGDTVVDTDPVAMVIERVQNNGDLLLYIGKDGVISEADIGDVSIKHGVDDRLFNG